MGYYPIFLELAGRRVAVAGAGRVSLRKVKGLLEAGARVTVIAPASLPAFEELPVTMVRRRFRPSDLEGATLAFAATDCRDVNHRVAAEAGRRGIPVNVADCPAECDFIVPARVRRGDLQVAASTSGRNPRLAVELRRKIAAILAAARRGAGGAPVSRRRPPYNDRTSVD